MVEPTGYTALDLIGFTDKGLYSGSANYVKNDIVHDSNEKMWRCLIDDTTGITPTEGVNWTAFISPPSQNPEAIGIGYGSCATAAATAAKEATLSGFNLKTNGYVSVKFTYDVPANATLNVNNTGTKAIYYQGAAITASVIKAGDIATFIYDGANFNLINLDSDSSQIQALSNQVSNLEDAAENKVLVYTQGCTATGGTRGQICRIPSSGTNNEITTDHVLAECVFSKPSYITSDVDWTTYAGYIELLGVCTNASDLNVTVTLIKKDN